MFVFPNTLSVFNGDKKIAIDYGYIEIKEDIYNDLLSNKRKWKNGKIVLNNDYVDNSALNTLYDEIYKLKSFLCNTDYKAIKYFEGVLSNEEYEPVKQEREKARLRINEIETELLSYETI